MDRFNGCARIFVFPQQYGGLVFALLEIVYTANIFQHKLTSTSYFISQRRSKIQYTALKKTTLFQQQLFFCNCFVSSVCFSNRWFIWSQHIFKEMLINFRCKSVGSKFQHKLTTKNDKILVFLKKAEETLPLFVCYSRHLF